MLSIGAPLAGHELMGVEGIANVASAFALFGGLRLL